jgi:hypothetical protein
MGILSSLLSALLKIAAIMFLLAGAAVGSIWLYKFSGVFPRVVYLSCSATDKDGTERGIPYAFVIDERAGEAYWDTPTKTDDYRTITLSEAMVIIEWDFDPASPAALLEAGYDAKQLSIDRLTGETRLSLMAKDGSKGRKLVSTGRCADQRPLF